MIWFSYHIWFLSSSIYHTAPVFHVKIYREHVISRATIETLDHEVSGFAVVLEGRKPAARLDISGTPGVEQLRPMEREVCKNHALLQSPSCSKAG